MRPMTVAMLGFGFANICACTTTYRGVESVSADFERDEVAAATSMSGDSIFLQGRVEKKGLRSEKVAEAGRLAFGHVEVKLKDKNLGYIVLTSARGKPGELLCLFEPDALEILAPVHEGQVVNLVCSFYKVEGDPPDRVPVFRQCWVLD